MYKNMMIINDSCEAFTIIDSLENIDKVVSIGSSVIGINSYSSGFDNVLQMSKIDSFTRHIHYFISNHLDQSVKDFVKYLKSTNVANEFDYKIKMDRKASDIYMREFFG